MNTIIATMEALGSDCTVATTQQQISELRAQLGAPKTLPCVVFAPPIATAVDVTRRAA